MLQQTRNTVQKQIILNSLCRFPVHPTADELYQRVRKVLPNISLGTVYRNLDKLTDSGDIQVIKSGRGQRRYDGNPARHLHIRCIYCGRVDDLSAECDVKELIKQYEAQASGYNISDVLIEFRGSCPACQ